MGFDLLRQHFATNAANEGLSATTPGPSPPSIRLGFIPSSMG
jgi:hypothetical protein